MRAWASAALASGKVESITGLILPAATSGQTFSSMPRAIAAFSATVRGRSVEPVCVQALAHQVGEIGGGLRTAGERHLRDAPCSAAQS